MSILEFIDTVTTRHRIEEALRKTATEGNLIKIADELGVNVAYVPKNKYKRPCFGPNQVRCRHQLRKIHVFRRVSRVGGDYGEFFSIVREPYQFGPKSDLYILIRNSPADGSPSTKMLLANYNIEPNPNGSWEQDLFLVSVGHPKPPCRRPDCQHSCPNCS